MKINYPQLSEHLQGPLSAIYIISGDELLFVEEAIDAIRTIAKKNGFNESITLMPDSGTDWRTTLHSHSHNISLFSDKKVVHLNLSHLTFNQTHGKILEEYALYPVPNILLIIHISKIESKLEKSGWYQTLDKIGTYVTVWPLPKEQLPQWIITRAKKTNLLLTAKAAEQLATLVEGNLLAAAQEIEKLALLHAGGMFSQNEIEDIVTDHARFDIFNLVDSALSGDSERCLRILDQLAKEDVEPTLILWALTRELRTLSDLSKQASQGIPLSSLFYQFRIWEKRKPPIQAFLQRNTTEKIWELLLFAAKIDRIIKGAETGNVWDALHEFTLKMAGSAILSL